VLGLDPRTEATEIRRKIGYVADSPTMYEWMEVDEIGWFSAGFYPDGYLENYRERIAKYHLPPRQKIRSLSKGQRGKVALSLALAHEPELLILDEPTSGLDPLVRREFLESMVDLAASGRTVLLSSHLLSEVERVADQVAILHRGRICISGNVAELRDTICEVTVKLTDPLATLPSLAPPASVLVEQTNGRQRRMLIRHFDESSESILRDSHSVFDVTQRPAGLEDLFVACTRDAVDEISLAPAEAIEVKS